MKKMKYGLINVMTLIFLLFGKVTWAETDLLNLSAYAEGSSPPYGENIIVKQDEKTAIKWVTRGVSDNAGKLKFTVSLSGEFEVILDAYGDRRTELFLTADEYKIKVDTYFNKLTAGDESGGSDQSNAEVSSKNTWKLSVSNNVAKLYINDVFSQKVTLKPGLVYTQLLVQGIDSNEHIYTLKISGSGGSTQPPVTGSGDFDSGKQAGIQQCVSNPASCGITVTGGGTSIVTDGAHATYNPSAGEVHIPLIDVPGPFGDTQTYEVYLIQQPLTFAFDLDMNRIIAK